MVVKITLEIKFEEFCEYSKYELRGTGYISRKKVIEVKKNNEAEEYLKT